MHHHKFLFIYVTSHNHIVKNTISTLCAIINNATYDLDVTITFHNTNNCTISSSNQFWLDLAYIHIHVYKSLEVQEIFYTCIFKEFMRHMQRKRIVKTLRCEAVNYME